MGQAQRAYFIYLKLLEILYRHALAGTRRLGAAGRLGHVRPVQAAGVRDGGRRRRRTYSGGAILCRGGGARFRPGVGLVFRLGDDAAALELVVRVDDALVEDAVRMRWKFSLRKCRSLKVSSDSSSCPSEKMPLMMVSICERMRAGVGSVSVRVDASTESASMRMAASLVCGRGPG